MATPVDTKKRRLFHFIHFLLFMNGTIQNLLSPLPNFDYASDLKETSDSNHFLFLIMSDINPLVKVICEDTLKELINPNLS